MGKDACLAGRPAGAARCRGSNGGSITQAITPPRRHPPSAIRQHPPSAIRHPPASVRHLPSANAGVCGLGLLDFHPHRLPADQVRSRRDLPRLRTRSCRYNQKFTPNLRHVFFRLANVSLRRSTRLSAPSPRRSHRSRGRRPGRRGFRRSPRISSAPCCSGRRRRSCGKGAFATETAMDRPDACSRARARCRETSSSWTSRPGAISRQADATAILPGRSIGRHPSVASVAPPRLLHGSRAAKGDKDDCQEIGKFRFSRRGKCRTPGAALNRSDRGVRSGIAGLLFGAIWRCVPAWHSRCLLPALESK